MESVKRKLKNKLGWFIELPLNLFDWIIFITIAALCFFCLEHGDILHTGGSSIAYLNGHFLDFYDYNLPYMKVNNYLPSTYVLFAIWNIPVRIFGLVTVPTLIVSTKVLMWYKLLPCCFYFMSSVIIFKIGVEIGLGTKKAKLCSYVFLTTPIGFFSQFIFGQYDIFTVFFVLLGLYYFFKKDNFKFILFFALAITFKYFALLIFIPLLLLREKNIGKIILNTLCAAVPFAAEVGLYLHSSAFKNGVFGFGATGYVFEGSIQLQYMSIRIFILVWVLLCAWAYFTNAKDKFDEIKWSLYFCNFVTFLLFGLSLWHPQWLLFAVPFWVLSTFISKRSDVFFFLDILLMLFFVGFTVNLFMNNVDEKLFDLGILGKYVKNFIGTQVTMADLFLVKDKSLWYSCFSALLLINAVFKHPKFCLQDFTESIDQHWKIVRTRFLVGVSIFLIPAFICFTACFVLPVEVFSVPQEGLTNVNPITTDRQVSQVFTATTDSISEVDVQIGTYSRTNHSKLQINIKKVNSNDAIYTSDIDVSNLTDNAFTKIEFPKLSVQRGEQYKISFKASETTDNDCVTIYRTANNFDKNAGYAVVDGQNQDYNLNIKVKHVVL